MTLQIVILAMIAAFLGLRLYSVLGRRAEHEEEPIDGRIDAKPGMSPLAPA
ncbi:MAG: Tim44 domain-containing protein, partial [Novosphingobium sp.]